MTRKEQIKEYLRIIGNGETMGIPFDVGFECGVEWADSHPHWISVEDELPKERDWYLIYDTNMGHDVCMWYGDCWGNCYKVTHWMPLPSIEHFADVSKKISSSVKPNNCKKGGKE